MSEDPKRRPLTLSQQRFILIIVAFGALLGACAGLATIPMAETIRAAIIPILTGSMIRLIPDAWRHYFPTKSADDDKA